MTRPVIGIVCCTRGIGDETAQVVIDRYVEAVTRHADCAALLIPARPDLIGANEIAGRIDGLLLTGSPSNMAPARFGAAHDPGEPPHDAGRDAMALAMIDAVVARGRPVLGICRGCQELNVAFGGTLRRGLGDPAGAIGHHAPDGVPLEAMFGYRHGVTLSPGGVLARMFGADRLTINSVHYQGIDRLGDGLVAEAIADDGLIEAISAERGGAPVLGVQWHPEWRTDDDEAGRTLFGWFGRALRGDRWRERA